MWEAYRDARLGQGPLKIRENGRRGDRRGGGRELGKIGEEDGTGGEAVDLKSHALIFSKQFQKV